MQKFDSIGAVAPMSSSLLVVLMAFTSFLFTFGAPSQSGKAESVPDLLLRDEFQRAEELLDKQPPTAENLALRGEVESRKGDFDRADQLYRQALKLNEKTARAHFG